jgi:hypothetical protein
MSTEDRADLDTEHCDHCELPIHQGDPYIALYRFDDREIICSCPEAPMEESELMDSWLYHDRCAERIKQDAEPCPRCGGHPAPWETTPEDEDENRLL